MDKLANFLHRWVRFVAGTAFWLHAVLLVTLPMPPLETLATRIGLKASETLLTLFFLMMAVLSGYGFWRFALDLLYIYVFPFIFTYKTALFGFRAIARLSKAYADRFFPDMQRRSFTWRAMLSELVADDSALIVPAATPPIQPVAIVVSSPTPQESLKPRFWRKLLFPFRSFTIVWCLLIIATDKPRVALFGLIIVSAHLLRFTLNLVQVLTSVQQFLKDAEMRALNYATGLLNVVMSAPDETLASPDVSKAVTYLALLRGSAFLLINRIEISYLFFVAVIFVYIAIYVRVAVLFAFVYLGISKLSHVPLGFLDAMVNSFAMPLSYTNYPRQWVLQMAEDVHSGVVLLLGVGAGVAYMRQKVDSFTAVAEALWAKLDQDNVRSRMAYAAKKSKPAA
jgi:hypothetical protein